jgi:hypothetical protein
MTGRDVEMMDDVAVVVLVHQHARGRRGAEAEAKTTLRPVAARLHAHFHDALSDRLVVGEARQMADGVAHTLCYHAGSADSIG